LRRKRERRCTRSARELHTVLIVVRARAHGGVRPELAHTSHVFSGAAARSGASAWSEAIASFVRDVAGVVKAQFPTSGARAWSLS